ncbi:MAG: hypothetical protein HY897_07530 [Deltaproteobacteria bacterium]|nr:hypothetical protein [Deltaproteobacteria bacterium]
MKNRFPGSFFVAPSLCIFLAAGCFVGLDPSGGGGADTGGPGSDGGLREDGGSQDPCAYVGAPNTTCCGPDGAERFPVCKDGNFHCPDGYAEAPLDSCGGGCEGLDFCDCTAREDCEAVSDGCLCDCDFDCNPGIDCVCKCGGGTYIGCRARSEDDPCGEHGLCVPGELPPGPIDPVTPCPSPHEDLYMAGPGCTPESGGNGFCCTEADPCWVMGAPYLTCCGENGDETSPRCEWGEFFCPEGFFEAEPGSCRAPCEGLEFCECYKRDDCEVLAEDCLCPCDYSCPGEPPCDCVCGGGKYLGCAQRTGACKDPATDCDGFPSVRCDGGWTCSDDAFCGYRCDSLPHCLFIEGTDERCAAYECDLGKFSTSGMTEGFGIGKSCEFLVICATTQIEGTLLGAILDAFPDMDCGGQPDYTCGEDAVASCIDYVKTLSERQVGDACRLSTDPAVSDLVCAGDL